MNAPTWIIRSVLSEPMFLLIRVVEEWGGGARSIRVSMWLQRGVPREEEFCFPYPRPGWITQWKHTFNPPCSDATIQTLIGSNPTQLELYL